MDKLAEQLRQDADAIEVEVSDALDARIQASLRGIEPKREPPSRPAWFWWASGLTGVATAMAVLMIINRPVEPVPTLPQLQARPMIDLKVDNAVLTQPLEEELSDIESDLKKAEQILRDDLDDIL